jgi:hypothetical protein
VRREGRYDHGPDQREQWLAEVTQVQAALDHFVPRGFEIMKVYYEPAELGARLGELGWLVQVSTTPSYFLYGAGTQGAAASAGDEGQG